MLRERQIRPHPGMPFTMNRNIPPFKDQCMCIHDEIRAFHAGSDDDKRRIFINNFDASVSLQSKLLLSREADDVHQGGNAAMIVEEYSDRRCPRLDPRSSHVVTFSGHTEYTLRENKRGMLGYLSANPQTKLPDLAYMTTARRTHDAIRTALSVKSLEELVNEIAADSARAMFVFLVSAEAMFLSYGFSLARIQCTPVLLKSFAELRLHSVS